MTKDKHIITTAEIQSLYEEKARYIAMADSYVRNTIKAEEIFSQCIFRLFQTKDRQYVSDPRAFFMSVIKNRCINELKRKKRELSLEQLAACDKLIETDIRRLTTQFGQEDCRNDFPELLENCKKKLPGLTYEIFMAKRLDKLSNKDICDMFKITESRIYFEIQRALQVFRKEFKDYMLCIAWVMICIGTFPLVPEHTDFGYCRTNDAREIHSSI